jgi:Protein of unknown function (DUF2889)
MLVVPERAGPANPLASSPARAPGSARRTTSIDTSRPEGLRRDSVVDARGRDLCTDSSGRARREHTQSFRARIAPDRKLLGIEADPPEPLLAQLIGLPVGPGFRARMAEILPAHAQGQTLLYALLDDLPGATLVSGYAVQRGEAAVLPKVPVSGADTLAQHVGAAENMCAGWATEATIVVTFRQKGSVPAPMGPDAPLLERDGDALSWHHMEPLAPESTRRRRRLDLIPAVGADQPWLFDSHFRDSYRDALGDETVVHEYVVEGALDHSGTRIAEARTDARVLPWVECPGAVVSTARMVEKSLTELRAEVRSEFVGTTTCTHLNDSFRSLSDLVPLRALVHVSGGGR